MAKLEAVIFDSDGTLFDTFQLIVAAHTHVSETHNLTRPSVEKIRQNLSGSMVDIFNTLYPGADIETILQTNNAYFAANAMKSAAFDGLRDVLDALTAQGLKIGILTNGAETMREVLKHHKLTHYFSSVVTRDRVTNPKPDPEGLLLATKECGTTPEFSVMVGDSVQDIAAGVNAHCQATIGVSHGYGLVEDLRKAGADYIANSLNEAQVIITGIINTK